MDRPLVADPGIEQLVVDDGRDLGWEEHPFASEEVLERAGALLPAAESCMIDACVDRIPHASP